MNTTTLQLPRITTVAAVQTLHLDVATTEAPLCQDAINRELVLCAKGQGDTAPGRWEQWLFAPIVVASLVAIVPTATTAGQWLTQWPGFARWVEQILL